MTSERWITDFKLSGNIIGKNHYDVFPEIPEYWKDIHQKCLKGEVQKMMKKLLLEQTEPLNGCVGKFIPGIMLVKK